VAQPVQYLVDADGKRIAVVLDMAEHERLLDPLDELEDIRAYDEAKAAGDEFIPLGQALAAIDHARQ
jgi:hypothetical protein